MLERKESTMLKRNATLRLRQGGLSFENYSWGQIISGTRAALVEAGIVPDGGFPGDPGARRHTAKSIDANGREVRVSPRGKYLYAVWRDWTPEERDAYYAEQTRREAEKAKRDFAESIVRSWPKTADAFRDDAHHSVEQGLRLIEAFVFRDGMRGGWRYDEAAQLQFQTLADRVRQLAQNGRVVLDRQLREQHTPTSVAGTVKATDAARADRVFQEWLSAQGVGR